MKGKKRKGADEPKQPKLKVSKPKPKRKPGACDKVGWANQLMQAKGKGKAKGEPLKAKPAPQSGRCLDRDCNAALNMERIRKSKWRPLELELPAKGKQYPELGYKRLRDKPPKAQQQQQQQQPMALRRAEQGALPAKGKEYPGLGYKRLRDKPPKSQPAVAQLCMCPS
ncbi:hypothetical protein QJQ45_004028 [Haematococcus lacustris]|nr:hypothetical protein QJQ45_004028 [Haematococcus lacustris]